MYSDYVKVLPIKVFMAVTATLTHRLEPMSSNHMSSRGDLLSNLHIKVPAVTAFFWIIKVLATTVGETFADFLNENLGLGLTKTSIIITVLTLIVIAFQFKSKQYIPVVYWAVVILISVAGTLITDNLTDNLGVALKSTTIIFAICLAVTLAIWYRVEGTLSIHSIRTTRRETFYWLTILFTFALGTAAGDLVNEHYAIGYRKGLLLFALLIAVVVVAYKFGLSSVITFWWVYVLTRPLGASLGDLLTQPVTPEDEGSFPGLGLSTNLVNGLFAIVIIALVAYLSTSKVDQITPEKFDDVLN
jgi:uncharacterized membrane-anchored protein